MTTSQGKDDAAKADQASEPPVGIVARAAAAGRRARRGGLMMIAAVVLLALNLRPAVNALGVVGNELQHSMGLSGTVTGVLFGLPPLCFAAIGFMAPALAARLGSHHTVILAVALLTGGQLLRAVVPGTWALFAGSILALGSIAIGNVLLPGLIRLHFPAAIGPMTALYTTVLMTGQTLGAGITIPIEDALGGTWRLGIGMWSVTAGITLIPWIVTLVRRGEADTAPARSPSPPETATARARQAPAKSRNHIPVFSLIRSPYAWAMAVFFGFQSLQAYVVFGWIPKVLIEAGMSEAGAGGILALLAAIGIPIAAVIPALLSAVTRQWTLVVAFSISLIVGYLWLLLIPLTATWLLALLIGFGLGSFPMGLALMALRARTPSGSTALSSFGQSVGYLFAAAGPIGFGFLHDVSGGPTIPLIALSCSVLPLLVGGLIVAGHWKIEDDLAARSR